ncbi:hypothetical protein MalM25_22450 [Planctomycetes bacterium MalM25]|nr:hypothetical protein MalM25_22450 [Planctomycetes bacterium MalM25]
MALNRAVLIGLLLLPGVAAPAGESDADPLAELPVAAAPGQPKSCCTLPSRFGAIPVATRLSVEPSDVGARVLVDGELFAEYVTKAGRQPIVWPIRNASGQEMTRSWPMGPKLAAEEEDHPHHQSLWFSHGGVNGHDFWHQAKGTGEGRPRIVHKEFVRSQIDAGDTVVVETTNDWTAAGENVLADTRTLVFGLLNGGGDSPSARYIDFTITLKAEYGPATFADTKEGSFAVRVPGAMKLDAGLGGQILNDRGQADAEAWGHAASWVAYSGPLAVAPEDGEAARGGLVMMSHPESFRPRCRWHVRGYGLFAANPFGESDFPADRPRQGTYILETGESLTLRYRVVFFEGPALSADFAGWYEQFALN